MPIAGGAAGGYLLQTGGKDAEKRWNYRLRIFADLNTINMKQLILLCMMMCVNGIANAQHPEMVADINTGNGDAEIQYLTEYNGKLYFAASTPATGRELWVTDGTQAGTKLVKDINPGPDSGEVRYLTVYNGKLYFGANDGVHNHELWVSDGTEAGTVMLKNIGYDDISFTNAGYPAEFKEYNGKLYFSANDGTNGYELWVTDGTEAGTEMVKDISVGSSYVSNLFVHNGKLFFSAAGNLYVSDGTEAGTMEVIDLDPFTSDNPHGFTEYNGKLYLIMEDDAYELWTTDGTEAGTKKVKDLHPGSMGGRPNNLIIYKGLLYFYANDPVYGSVSAKELWVSDGTESGTRIFADLTPGGQGSLVDDQKPYVYNDRMYFVSFHNQQASTEIYSHDGSAASVKLLKDINSTPKTGGDPMYLNSYNGWLVFTARDATSDGRQLWASNGMADSTKKLLPITGSTSNALSNTSEFITYNGAYYYKAKYSNAVGEELYKLSMAPPGPISVASVYAANEISIYPSPASDVITISFEKNGIYQIHLTNAIGQVMQMHNVSGGGKVIDISNYPTGMYIVTVRDMEGKQYSKKIMKK